MGFAIAWWLDSTQGYHVVMSVLLHPAVDPLGRDVPDGRRGRSGSLIIARANPMAYAVAGVRRALYGGAAARCRLDDGGARARRSPSAFALVAVLVAVRVCSRRGDKP